MQELGDVPARRYWVVCLQIQRAGSSSALRMRGSTTPTVAANDV